MGKQINIRRARIRALLYCVLTLASVPLFSACTRDNIPRNEDGAWVLLTVKMPGSAASAAMPPANLLQTESETRISEISILIFEYINNEYLFSYKVSGEKLTSATDQERFRALILSTTSPLKLMVLANARDALALDNLIAGTSESVVRTLIELPFSDEGLSGDLPMYGEVTLPTGVNTGDNNITLDALRAIARVDVVKELDNESGDFTLEEVYVFRAYDKIRLIPDEASGSGDDRQPSIPADATFLSDPVFKQAGTGGADAITNIYIPESYAASTTADKVAGTTAVIVGGRFGASTNPVTYYRADFSSASDDNFGKVLRNHKYTFVIKRVMAPGWVTAQDAANNLASSIVVELIEWEDFSSDIYFGGNRFAISSRSIDLRFPKNREKRLDVESSLEYQIQWLDDNGIPTGASTSQHDVTISTDNFDATIVKDAGDPDPVTHLLFRTLNDNHTGNNIITDKLRITFGDWNIDVTVNQDNTAMYSGRHFNVLSVASSDLWGAGNLGTTSALPSGRGLAMRQILDHQFNPNGVVRIGGFAFDELNTLSHSGLINATTGDNLTSMDRIIRMQNVIYLSYYTNVSATVAGHLLTWLNEDPRRVLIVAADDANTNVNMRNLLPQVTWIFSWDGARFIRGAAAGAATDDFFSGPFGEIAEGATFPKVDNTIGRSRTYPSDIIPLVMSDEAQRAMVFGVDRDARIIYHGDANLFQYPQLNNTAGNVVNDLDKLMANTWSWIVEQLVYGND